MSNYCILKILKGHAIVLAVPLDLLRIDSHIYSPIGKHVFVASHSGEPLLPIEVQGLEAYPKPISGSILQPLARKTQEPLGRVVSDSDLFISKLEAKILIEGLGLRI